LDVTDFLDITHTFHNSANISGEVKSVPNFIPKTDETRVQLLQDVLTRHKESLLCDRKVDGCSVTYSIKMENLCMLKILNERNRRYLFGRWHEFEIEEKLKQYYDAQKTNMAIQGETYWYGYPEE